MSRDPEALITDCIGQYPTLFPNRTSVLHHLFIVLGCGFEWHNGELVDALVDKLDRRLSLDLSITDGDVFVNLANTTITGSLQRVPLGAGAA